VSHPDRRTPAVGSKRPAGRPLRFYPEGVNLLEREHELGVLEAAIRAAVSGSGSGVAVTGDAGTGKSVLLDAAVSGTTIRVLRAGCDPLRTPRPLGPLRDIAADAGLGELLHDDDAGLSRVCEDIYTALRSEPTVLVIEDVHWIDAASVDVLRFLARRIETLPLCLLVSCRDRELDDVHPVRALLGDIARIESFTRLPLRSFSLDAVQALVGDTALDPEKVHVLTGGNPFFVTEIAKDPDGPMPVSVRDAVLDHAAVVAKEDFETLQLVAAAPDRVDHRLLPALGIDLPTLRRLDASGLLLSTGDGLQFRHELARLAVQSTIPPAGRASLHARLLQAHEQLDFRDPAVMTHHAVEAGDDARVVQYATAAAEQATRAGSHTDAAAFLQTAIEHLPDGRDAERAGLLQALGLEQYMTSRLAEGIATIQSSFPLWRRVDDLAGLAAAHDNCAVLEYYNARRNDAETHADRAAEMADEAGARVAFGTAKVTRAYLAAHRSEFDFALACCDEAEQVAREEKDAGLAVRSGLIRSVVGFAQGDVEARAQVTRSIEEAREHNLDELASTGYSNLAYIDVEQRRLRSAAHVLEQSLPFADERDIAICRHWQTGVRSRLHLYQGRWDAALEDAAEVLSRPGMPLGTLWPLLVSVLVPLRRGMSPSGDEPLEAAWALTETLDEPVRSLPLLTALAERAWMTGADDDHVSTLAVEETKRLQSVPGASWSVGELAVWLSRLDLLEEVPTGTAEPHRLMLEGRHEEAARWWHEAGDPFQEALSWGDSADPEHQVRGVTQLDILGATGTADRRRLQLRTDGVANVPPRPRASTRANPSGLTNRQLEVATLLARGLTNAEIASRLYISPKTADHHVSAVLMRMGLSNRREVIVQAEELGLA
jgi:DNA-binding CsgD family transcriptional regulator/tetratricopeptide (TPR) repeat protein